MSLEDCGYYVRWLFDHPERANGMDLVVAIDHVAYADLAAAFEKVTGDPAIHRHGFRHVLEATVGEMHWQIRLPRTTRTQMTKAP